MALPDFLRSLKGRPVDPERARFIVASLGERASEYPEHAAATAAQLRHLDRALEVLRRCKPHLTAESINGNYLAIEAMILAKLGRFQEAVDLARSAYEAAPTWHSACAVANACMRAGQRAQPIELLTVASGLDPEDASAPLQIGDLHLEDGDWASALAAYDSVLRSDESHAWALPSALFCRHRLTGDAEALRRLRLLAEAPADECGVQGILETLVGSFYSPETGRRRALYLLGKLNDRSAR